MTGHRLGIRLGHYIAPLIPAFMVRWFFRTWPRYTYLGERAIAELIAEEGLTEEEQQIAREALGIAHSDGTGCANSS